MLKSTILFMVASACLLSAHVQAQTTAAPSAKALAVRDSVFAQAAAIRLASGNAVNKTKSNFFAIRGLRTVTKSYTLINGTIPVLVKKHVVKRKTMGALVEKTTYFNRGQRQLQEEYQNGQLANFTLVSLPAKNSVKETVQFVQGDYISINRQKNPLLLPTEQKPAQEFYHYPVPPVAR